MKLALLLLVGLIAVGTAAYFLLFPRDTFIIFSRPGGGTVTFSRTSVSFHAAPDHYAANGFDHLEPYVARLLVPAGHGKTLSIFTPDGNRGFSFIARDGIVQASFAVEWRHEPEKEAAIRAFFASRSIAPSSDYLSGNGGVPDTTRLLEYPVSGSTAEVTAITKEILQELCGISPAEALDISYRDK